MPVPKQESGAPPRREREFPILKQPIDPATVLIDPTKVVRAALQNAASVASLMLTTEALVADRPKKKEAGAATPPGGIRIRAQVW